MTVFGAALALLGIVAAAGCGSPGSAAAVDSTGAALPNSIAMADTALVAALADMHVLEARRTLVRDSTVNMAGLRDSVLARHGFDAKRFARALDDIAGDETQTALTWLAVQDRLDALLRALPVPDSGAAVRVR